MALILPMLKFDTYKSVNQIKKNIWGQVSKKSIVSIYNGDFSSIICCKIVINKLNGLSM